MLCPVELVLINFEFSPHKRYVFLLILYVVYIEGHFQAFPLQIAKGSINQTKDGKL